MGVLNRLLAIMTARMGKQDKQRLMNDVVTTFFAEMTSEEKIGLIDNWMDKFFADMTIEDKQKIVENTMPRIKDGFSTALIMPQMLTAMMGLGQQNIKMSDMMPTMVSKSQFAANVKTPGDCKPWEYCPCRRICEDNLKQIQGGDEK